ncbi:hypothetical protein PIB30_067842 [Stylosanthes scabra]|uniref:Glutaredoxin domain-containing protein n=1 Tax=Stylosanthes scabra TaxID=79078 RepID=A0ABU6XP50_9FABA|nr:hypothetical protein [Stylosanthes scabra]
MAIWPTSWLKSHRRTRTEALPAAAAAAPARSKSSGFSCSSLKDIETILQAETIPEPDSPKTPKSIFRRLRITTSLLRSFTSRSNTSSTSSTSLRCVPTSPPPDSDAGSVVIYYTSLRVVRRTFDDCRAVRSILRGFHVAVDERDVSIDDRFREELNAILGGGRRSAMILPCVFVGGVFVGGADDVRRIYESGELQRMIERLPRSQPYACKFCGGLRFVVCDECFGSHKVYATKSGFRNCNSCNINGLIRCPACYFVLPRHTKCESVVHRDMSW